MRIKILHFLIGLTLLATAASAEEAEADRADPSRNPFRPGERLVYALSWSGFPVGQAALETLDPVEINGEAAHHVRFLVRTNAFADGFYRVRISIESFPAVSGGRSLRYAAEQAEGSRYHNFTVDFDWENNQIVRTDKDGNSQTLEAPGPLHDPLSILFFFRMQELITDTLIPLPATDGRKVINVDARIGRKERVEVPLGSFDALLVQPDLKDLGGVFRTSRDASMDIWITDDERGLPIRLFSRVRVGSFRGDLVRIESMEDGGTEWDFVDDGIRPPEKRGITIRRGQR